MSPRRSLAISLLLALVLAPTARAQRVALRIAPRVGDTIHLRLDQHVEMRRVAQPTGAEGAPLITELTVVTRAIIEGADARGATVLATTDSVALSSTMPAIARGAERARRAVGKRVRFRIAPDGMATVLQSDGAMHADVESFFARMPATLPREPVAVGASWSRTMGVPLASDPTGVGGEASLRATFRLDSLTRGGELAWLSIRGTIDRATTTRGDLQGATMAIDGDMSGRLLLDRRRGWITDARIEFLVRSTVTPAAAGARPILMQLRVSQRMRAQ